MRLRTEEIKIIRKVFNELVIQKDKQFIGNSDSKWKDYEYINYRSIYNKAVKYLENQELKRNLYI